MWIYKNRITLHINTEGGVKPDPRKIECVVWFQVPEKEKDIKAFIGLVGYYRKFIDN